MGVLSISFKKNTGVFWDIAVLHRKVLFLSSRETVYMSPPG